ncbi:hypothetical protein GGS20DRAFT_584639 [Poronia punctata]|nr:hypothetical protein GGS20DRAFT_584639 [Poronia punctata]
MSTSKVAGATAPEYQHFIPQFMLRNFAHKYDRKTDGAKRRRGGNKNNKHPGEHVVNNVNLEVEPFAIEETKVKRILGRYDMYQDTSLSGPQQREVESLLGKLESQVSPIFRRIIKTSEKGEQGLWLTRSEMDTIRRFMFILKYRGPTFYQRFANHSRDTYNFNDREPLLAYMDKKKLERPIDVWFEGLKAIMKLEMGEEGWKERIRQDMYEWDAAWFLSMYEKFYMAICTPEDPRDEFILTDNSHNVFEGPQALTVHPLTGELQDGPWSNFHEFCPVSAKLMIVLRSVVLPVPEEDADPSIAAMRAEWRKQSIDDVYMSPQTSILADLPIRKARNNYTELVAGQLVFSSDMDPNDLRRHKFCLSLFPNKTRHVNIINHLLFDNAYAGSTIVFRTREAFLRTLEWYMTVPCIYGKVVAFNHQKQRRRLLTGLAALLKSLGFTKEAIWEEKSVPRNRVYSLNPIWQIFAKIRVMRKRDRLAPEPDPPLYYCDDESVTSLEEDLEQADRMLNLRIKIDVWSQGVPYNIRHQARRWLVDAYLRCHSRRVLFFVKRLRFMLQTMPDPTSHGVEDLIASALYRKMPARKLNRLMYTTMLNEVEVVQPNLKPVMQKAIGSSMEETRLLGQIYKYAFGLPGSIKDCGIPEIEDLVLKNSEKTQNFTYVESFYAFNRHDQIELSTRALVKKNFKKVMAARVESRLLDELEAVFFTLSYPTFDIDFAL